MQLDLGGRRRRGDRGVVVGEFDLEVVDEPELPLVAGVEALAEDAPPGRGRPGVTPSARARWAGRLASGSSTGSRRFETRSDMPAS